MASRTSRDLSHRVEYAHGMLLLWAIGSTSATPTASFAIHTRRPNQDRRQGRKNSRPAGRRPLHAQSAAPIRPAKNFMSRSARRPTSMKKMSGRKTSGAPALWKSIPTAAACEYLPKDCAIPLAWIGSRNQNALDRRQRARPARRRSGARLSHQRQRRRFLRLAVLLLRPERRPAQKRPTTRSRRQSDQTGLRPGLAHRGARFGFLSTANRFPSAITAAHSSACTARGTARRWSATKFAFVPFANGKPAGPIEDILTGFIADESKFEAYGRPVGVTVLPDGSLLVADDSGGKVWRVTAKK